MNIAVCDDNNEERANYIKTLTALADEADALVSFTQYENGKQMLFELEDPEAHPDVIYLDINMPDMSGMDVAEELRGKGYRGEIVFLTGSDRYWRPAFDVHAYHYIIKDDVTDRKFAEIFKSVIKAVIEKNEECMLFSSCGQVVSVPIKSIKYFEVVNRIITVYYDDGQFEFYSTLSKLEEQLYNRGFVRVHKSYLVPSAQIVKATYKYVVLRDGMQIPVGRAYQKGLKSLYSEKPVANTA